MGRRQPYTVQYNDTELTVEQINYSPGSGPKAHRWTQSKISVHGFSSKLRHNYISYAGSTSRAKNLNREALAQ